MFIYYTATSYSRFKEVKVRIRLDTNKLFRNTSEESPQASKKGWNIKCL